MSETPQPARPFSDRELADIWASWQDRPNHFVARLVATIDARNAEIARLRAALDANAEAAQQREKVFRDYIECCEAWLPDVPEDDPRVDAYHALMAEESVPQWDTGHPRGCHCWQCGP